MFHTDTRANVVWRYAFDPATGKRGTEQPFFRFDRPATGGVDGAAMDSDGGYWPAMYGGSKLLRLLPDGTVDSRDRAARVAADDACVRRRRHEDVVRHLGRSEVERRGF